MKKFIYSLLFLAFGSVAVYGQTSDFCNAVSTIIHDGPNKFRNVRGKLTNADANATVWACNIAVPGTLKARFVASMGLFYEGAFLQTHNKEGIKAVYDQYKALLDSCLSAKGYTVSLTQNFYPGLSEYKKVIYLPDASDDAEMVKVPPPHITLEVSYTKELDAYTVIMYIFEH